MSVKQVALHLGVSVPTVWRLLWRRELGHAKCGRRVLVPSEEIERFLKARFTPAVETDTGEAEKAAPPSRAIAGTKVRGSRTPR